MKHILLVDDNQNFADTIVIGLKKKGYQTDATNEPFTAIEKLIANKYDVLISDINMPKMNGIELAVIARKMSPEMKIILISAYDFNEYKQEYPEIENYPLLSKPFDINKLSHMLECNGEI
jgi:DNA-binding NtrC family response regulator